MSQGVTCHLIDRHSPAFPLSSRAPAAVCLGRPRFSPDGHLCPPFPTSHQIRQRRTISGDCIANPLARHLLVAGPPHSHDTKMDFVVCLLPPYSTPLQDHPLGNSVFFFPATTAARYLGNADWVYKNVGDRRRDWYTLTRDAAATRPNYPAHRYAGAVTLDNRGARPLLKAVGGRAYVAANRVARGRESVAKGNRVIRCRPTHSLPLRRQSSRRQRPAHQSTLTLRSSCSTVGASSPTVNPLSLRSTFKSPLLHIQIFQHDMTSMTLAQPLAAVNAADAHPLDVPLNVFNTPCDLRPIRLALVDLFLPFPQTEFATQ
ncbi:hypothetical protein R3P38DRAFT_3189925 [Favolaschia claudopus]|uniref:Uncharacterized protein n=1 Tax=Favolaschia claudopus TaxID=2862362 RepID=A0AAW0BQ88_9AGAR